MAIEGDWCWDKAKAALTDGSQGLNIAALAVDRPCARGQADRLALICLGKRYERRKVSFGQLSEGSARVARVLLDLGVTPGDTVAVLMNRTADLYLAALGIWKAGAVFCPLFTSFGPGPLKSRMEVAHAKVLITDDSLYARKVAPIRGGLAELAHVLVVGEGGTPAHAHAGTQDFHALVDAASPAQPVATDSRSAAFIHFTSGTTGTPKGAVHGHGVAIAHLATGEQVFHLSQDDVYWCTADPGWITSTAYGIIAPLLCGAVSIVDEAEFDSRRWYGILKDEKVTVWYTTPTSIRMMMRQGAALARIYRENSLRLAASVGEPLNSEAVTWGERALGAAFLDTWWQTETGAISISNLPGAAKPGSMGRPLPGVTVALVQRDLSRLTVLEGADQVGELAVRADLPSLFIGCVGEPDRYENSFQDGWYLTGDLVRRDEDGFYWFVGRADDMIKSSGHTVGPFEIEATLMNHPAVAEIGVVGKPDLLVREVPVAFISLNPGFEAGAALTLELAQFARKELGVSLAPREFHFVDSLPKTNTGKILRRALKAKALAEPEGDELPMVPLSRFDDE